MCKSKDKIPLCWKCRWMVFFFLLAVLGMWGIICFLGKPESDASLNNWITVLIFLVTIVCTALPLYMNNRYLELEKKIDDQRKKLKDEISEQQKTLKDEIEKTNQETYKTASTVYLNLCQLTCKLASLKKDLLPHIADNAITTVDYMLKSKSASIEVIKMTLEVIRDLINEKIVNIIPHDKYIKTFCGFIKNDIIKSNEELFNECIQIIRILNDKKVTKGSGGNNRADKPE